MEIWTEKNLTEHRNRMGWPPLENKVAANVLYILNEAIEDMRSIKNISWIEPALCFSTNSTDKKRLDND